MVLWFQNMSESPFDAACGSTDATVCVGFDIIVRGGEGGRAWKPAGCMILLKRNEGFEGLAILFHLLGNVHNQVLKMGVYA